ASWHGLADALNQLESALDALRSTATPLDEHTGRMRRTIEEAPVAPHAARRALVSLHEDGAELDRALLALVETGAFRHEVAALQAVRTWIARFHQQREQMRRELDELCPWLAWEGIEAPPDLRLATVPEA